MQAREGFKENGLWIADTPGTLFSSFCGGVLGDCMQALSEGEFAAGQKANNANLVGEIQKSMIGRGLIEY